MSEEIEFKLDEASDLAFQISIEAPEVSKPSFRFVCESKDVSYMFPGEPDGDGTVHVAIPAMKNKLAEGKYDARLEVIIEDKYFAPVKMKAAFVQPVRVQVESVSSRVTSRVEEQAKQSPKPKKPIVSVTASKVTKAPVKKKPAPKRKRKPGTLNERYEQKTKKRQVKKIDASNVDELRAFLREEIKSGR